ncbi:MAG TPA: AtpZ/AtpI family protein [Pirellulales bacterium]|jgi:ATP synthase protein I|nr:AtpZ/AtpI family protein [Pirellulales bacterium]
MHPPQDKRPPMAVAMEWVSRITTVALEMVVPGVIGWFIDRWLGTGFIAIIGFGLGLVGGMYHLIVMANSANGRRNDK